MDKHYFYLKVGVLSPLLRTLVGLLYCPSLLLVASTPHLSLFQLSWCWTQGLRIPPNPLTSCRKSFHRHLPFGKSESRLQAIVKPSSPTGQTLQGVIPQSSDANGRDQALNPSQGWPENRNGAAGKNHWARINTVSRGVILALCLRWPGSTLGQEVLF